MVEEISRTENSVKQKITKYKPLNKTYTQKKKFWLKVKVNNSQSLVRVLDGAFQWKEKKN